MYIYAYEVITTSPKRLQTEGRSGRKLDEIRKDQNRLTNTFQPPRGRVETGLNVTPHPGPRRGADINQGRG